jgi:DNA recombination protein Rad52
MSFTATQVRALKRSVRPEYVRQREINGRTLCYIEGWHAIAEANRIFGFGDWDRETVESRCVLSREVRGTFLTVYVVKVRVTVRVEGDAVVREGFGTGEGRAASPGESHEFAIKGAETDATKRALATFGKPFGAALYINGKRPALEEKPAQAASQTQSSYESPQDGVRAPFAFAQFDARGNRATPQAAVGAAIPVGTSPEPGAHIATLPQPQSARSQPTPFSSSETAQAVAARSGTERRVPSPAERVRVDTSLLAFGNSPRRRNREHLKFVSAQACLICGRTPSDAHHLRFAQPRAMGRKVSDEFTVPLCRIHHRELHHAGDETAWWKRMKTEPLQVALRLWKQTRERSDAAEENSSSPAEDGDNRDETAGSHERTPLAPNRAT